MNESAWKCQACGFRIFNRRYPKCESCGAPLAPSMLYTAQELATLHEQEQQVRSEFESLKAKEEAELEARRLSGGGDTSSFTYLSS